MTFYNEIDLPLVAGHNIRIDDNGSIFERSVIDGGVRVLSQHLPHMRSTYVSFWVGAGSRDEHTGTEGSTHFLEHLLFKGTERRTSLDISQETDHLGGEFNAATSKQYTCYYGHTFEDELPQAIDLLADMVTSASLHTEDFAMERGVILEELAMYADDASQVAMEALPQLVYGDHPLARPVGGTRETVNALEHASLLNHYRAVYHPEELVVTAVGAVNHEQLCELVAKELRRGGWELNANKAPRTRRIATDFIYTQGDNIAIKKEVEQASVMVGIPGVSLYDTGRPAMFALSTILGSGQSSRLFQEIREKRGLAYSAYAFPSIFREGGMLGMAAGCSPDNAQTVRDLMIDELRKLARDGVTDTEVESAFRRIRADIVFDGERIGSMMNRLGTSEIIRGTLISFDEHVRQAREVSAEDIVELARDMVERPVSSVIVGPARG